MNLGLEGKAAFVMGASSGLGRAIAETLVGEGARVAVSARPGQRLEAAAEALGATPAPADTGNPGEVAAAVEATEAAFGRLDIVVTNCGGPRRAEFAELTDDDWHQGFQHVWMSAVEAIRAALPGMTRRRWGRIVMVTSSTVREPLPALTLSNSLRPGLAGLANSLSREVAGSGVTVNVLAPGLMDTERLADLGVPRDSLASAVPAGRIGQPEELAALAAFVASERAAYVTGQIIACDGGRMRSI